MIYTPKIHKAIDFAIEVHQGQVRKGKGTSYITHPLTVGLILSQVGASEDVIIAGILHDTIEDCDPWGSVTKNTIEKEFGNTVAEMVDAVTEQDKTLPWDERKRLALEHVPYMSKDSLLVKSADVLHNLTDQIEDYKKEGDSMFARFNAGKEKQLLRYQKLIKAIGLAWKENPLFPELQANLDKLEFLWG